jgi:glutaredoxin-related protein
MPRPILDEADIHPSILDEADIHPSIRQMITNLHGDLIQQVQTAVGSHPVVVVGMSGNPFVGKARKALANAGVRCEHLEFGSYFAGWRRRNALKMWTGWPTFPMVFVRGTLIGGGDDLNRLIASGELNTLLAG